ASAAVTPASASSRRATALSAELRLGEEALAGVTAAEAVALREEMAGFGLLGAEAMETESAALNANGRLGIAASIETSLGTGRQMEITRASDLIWAGTDAPKLRAPPNITPPVGRRGNSPNAPAFVSRPNWGGGRTWFALEEIGAKDFEPL